MKVIVKEPFKGYEVREIEKGYRTYSQLVGGLIEIVDIHIPGVPGIVAVINEKGKTNGSAPNLQFNSLRIREIFCGTVFFCKEVLTIDGAELTGLDDDEIEELLFHLPLYFKSLTEEEAERIDPNEYVEIHMLFFGE